MKRLAYTFARLLLGGIFLTSGAMKWLDPYSFADTIAHLKILPVLAINPVAILVIWSEIILGIFLLSNRLIKETCRLLIGMNCLFICVLAFAIHTDNYTSCGCFGELNILEFGAHGNIVRNMVFILITYALLRFNSANNFQTSPKK